MDYYREAIYLDVRLGAYIWVTVDQCFNYIHSTVRVGGLSEEMQIEFTSAIFYMCIVHLKSSDLECLKGFHGVENTDVNV